MTQYKVKCVNIDQGSQYDDCRCIETIGFPAEEGGTATRTPATVYDWVEKDGHTVVVVHNGSETEVHGVKDDDGTKYVRTAPNDTKNDNLLQQPSC